MNKKELICSISRELGLSMSQDKITLVLDKAVEITKRTIAAGESVKWSGFGSFVMKDIPSKRLYSPKLKEYIVTKDTKRITFAPSKTNEVQPALIIYMYGVVSKNSQI